ncbi:MAG: T9SS type A sorting domain-containing protein [Candidatus Latescibacteria bacterium]|jgi:hypothetical protein|nr:hypothetical protein [Gemmatimonadaceae bacterium]MDP6016575.1 T9SS type A sorting domain-containing protein [Candidatus Latescibacterota bacterium]MDP7447619.1 T9SS type A sorting domain-containing protein [Candidatus Latescibacterota bacterium]HJP34088.1 T9SS type A sorting domain-containing protein [Candidatus Latescibacterota bacterium]
MNRSRIALQFALAALLTTGAVAQSDLFILTSDFATGSTALLPADADAAQVNVIGIHSDASGHYQKGRVYIVNRLGADNILVLDPADLATPVIQFSVGNGSNPRDIEILAEGKAYVTRYGSTDLLVVDPRDGSELGTIDLSAYADADGLPEMDRIVRIGDRVYVSCQRLDRDAGFTPGDGVLVVIDINSDTVVGDIALSADNPNSVLVVGDQIIVSGTAGFGDRAGGIDHIDTRTGMSTGLVISEEVLGGDLSALVLRTSNAGFAVVLDENFANTVVPVNLETGVVGAPLEGLSGGFIATMAIDGNRLLIGDQGSFGDPTSAGLKIFDATSGDLLAGPIDTGLPPNSIVVLGPSAITAVREELGAALPQDTALGSGYPNPFNATVRVPFDIAVGGAVEMDVYDLLGRRVRSLMSRRLVPGGYSVTWDGTDAAGQTVANGTYFMRLRTGERRSMTKVMLLK